MTSTVAEAITDALPGTPGLALISPPGGIVVLMLIGLLAIRLLAQVAAVGRSRAVMRTVEIAAGPLVIALVLILYARFQEILPLG